jgi:hypothetical protein
MGVIDEESLAMNGCDRGLAMVPCITRWLKHYTTLLVPAGFMFIYMSMPSEGLYKLTTKIPGRLGVTTT